MNQQMYGKTFHLNLDEFGTIKKTIQIMMKLTKKHLKKLTFCVILPLLWFNYTRKCNNTSI